MVLLPLIGVGALGLRAIRAQEQLVTHRVAEVQAERLADLAAPLSRALSERGRELERFAERLPTDVDGIRRVLATSRLAADVLVLDPKGEVLFPPPRGPRSSAERELLMRTRPIWDGRVLPTLTKDRPTGWYGWYYDDGLNLLRWRVSGERIVAVELPRIELMSLLVAALPSTVEAKDGQRQTEGRTALLDSGGNTIYQWGNHDPGTNRPATLTPLPAPLGAWRLAHWPAPLPAEAAQGGSRLVVAIGTCGLAVALLLIAVVIFRSRSREMRLAARRVSFVNQVSHELRTPLTNIRLYAELLESEMPESDAGARAGRHIGVIVSESQRLSRLIANVLTLARGDQERLRLRQAPGSVDTILAEVLATFAPSLDALGIEVDFEPDAAEMVLVDADVVEQVVANLLSNVEKYAATGKYVRVSSRRAGDLTTITVADRGPGIPSKHRQRVFEPYQRLGDQRTDQPAGTGIGLDIARRLAILHGGAIELIDQERAGACFRVTLQTPRLEAQVEGSEMVALPCHSGGES